MNTYPKGTQETESPKFPSLYRQIAKAAGPDGLPGDFDLKKLPARREGDLPFADGAVDGIAMYHTCIEPRELGALTHILGMISDGDPRAEEELEAFFSRQEGFGYASMLSRVDGLQDWIIDHKDELDPRMIFSFCLWTLKESRYPECVKFALSVLELLNPSGKEDREPISTLALNDELTLFCSYVIRGWENGNEEMFRLAQRVHGWGRIFLVRQLEADTPEIREWLLREGWRNNVLPSYTARKCAEDGKFLALLRRERLTDEEFEAAQGLMGALMDEGPVRNLSVMEDGEEILREYLRHGEARGIEDAAAREWQAK